jgi:hypothetical protein
MSGTRSITGSLASGARSITSSAASGTWSIAGFAVSGARSINGHVAICTRSITGLAVSGMRSITGSAVSSMRSITGHVAICSILYAVYHRDQSINQSINQSPHNLPRFTGSPRTESCHIRKSLLFTEPQRRKKTHFLIRRCITQNHYATRVTSQPLPPPLGWKQRF